MPPAAPGPGPGTYDLVDYHGVPKHYMSSSVFVSTSKRSVHDSHNLDLPGPGKFVIQ